MMPPKFKTTPSSPGPLGTPAAVFPLVSPTRLPCRVLFRNVTCPRRMNYLFLSMEMHGPTGTDPGQQHSGSRSAVLSFAALSPSQHPRSHFR